jgi:hypothetical protein
MSSSGSKDSQKYKWQAADDGLFKPYVAQEDSPLKGGVMAGKMPAPRADW